MECSLNPDLRSNRSFGVLEDLETWTLQVRCIKGHNVIVKTSHLRAAHGPAHGPVYPYSTAASSRESKLEPLTRLDRTKYRRLVAAAALDGLGLPDSNADGSWGSMSLWLCTTRTLRERAAPPPDATRGPPTRRPPRRVLRALRCAIEIESAKDCDELPLLNARGT